MRPDPWQLLRLRLWHWLRRNHPQDRVLTPWLLGCYTVLFPRQGLLWLLQRDCGYDVLTDTCTFHGVRFSSSLVREMAASAPDVAYQFSIEKPANLLTVKRIHVSNAKEH